MQPEQLNSTLLWCLRIACPVFLVLFVKQWRWHWPTFVLMVATYWVRWCFFYDAYSIEPTRTSDAVLSVLKVLATIEAVAWPYRANKTAVSIICGIPASVAVLFSTGVFGFDSQWDAYESMKLTLHCALAMSLFAAVLWGKLKDDTEDYLWGHVGLMFGLMFLHIIIRSWILPPPEMEEARTEAWNLMQCVFRSGFVVLLVLWLWLSRFFGVVRTSRRRLPSNSINR